MIIEWLSILSGQDRAVAWEGQVTRLTELKKKPPGVTGGYGR